MNNEVILNVVDACTIEKILSEEALARLGLEKKFYHELADIFESNPSKIEEAFFVDGKLVGACEGVRSWDLLRKLAKSVGADTSIAQHKSDRGTQADALGTAIRRKLLEGIKVPEKASIIEVRLPDLSSLAEIAFAAFRDRGEVEAVPDATPVVLNHRWGYVETYEGSYALTHDGLGRPHAITEEKKMPLGFVLRYQTAGGRYKRDMAACYAMELGPKSLHDLPVEERLTLGSFVDSVDPQGRPHFRDIEWQNRLGGIAVCWIE